MPAVMTLKNVVIGAMFGFAATGYGIASAHASVTTAPDNHLLSTLKYVELEAEQGDKNMQLFLGRAYIEGSNGLKADPLKGMYWLKKAADETPAVQAMIGDLFKNGRGLPRDNQKAIEWYTKAANEALSQPWLNWVISMLLVVAQVKQIVLMPLNGLMTRQMQGRWILSAT